ncbi:MAG: Hpt domain-containing protein [Gaiellaceae bacterium]
MSAPSTSPVLDAAVIDELRSFGDAFVDDLVGQFVGDTDLLLAELRAALAAGDPVAVARIAHSLKGSSGQMGGRRFAMSCGRLEEQAAQHLVGGSADLLGLELDYAELCRALLRHDQRALPSQHAPSRAQTRAAPGSTFPVSAWRSTDDRAP